MSIQSKSRKLTGCQSCRVRHLKCDFDSSVCSKCTQSGNECIRGYNVRFRYFPKTGKDSNLATGRDFVYSNSQKWVKTPSELRYHDETPDLIEIYEQTSSPSEGSSVDVKPVVSEHSPLEPTLTHRKTSELPPQSLHLSPISTINSVLEQNSSSSRPLTPGSSSSLLTNRQGTPNSNIQMSPMSTTSSPSTVPLSQRQHDTADINISTLSLPQRRKSFSGSVISLSMLSNFPDEYPGEYHACDFSISYGDSMGNSFAESIPVFSDVSEPLTIPRSQCIWPLRDVREAELMRYYIDSVAICWDLCDAENSFATIIPQRAAYCPTLLNAIFAISARHLNRVRNYDPYAADRYHQRCLSELQKIISDPSSVMDENLLAATIILRTMEEVDVALYGSDTESHLVGAKALIALLEHGTPSLLFQKLFFVALRQEINIAFRLQRAVDLSLTAPFLDRSLEPTDDCTWANRMVINCADVLNYCFSESSSHSSARWKGLFQFHECCLRSLPSSFEPIYFSPASSGSSATTPLSGSDRSSFPSPIVTSTAHTVFPQIWLQSTPHVTGLQHHLLAKILLTVYNPSLPRLGPSLRMHQLRVETSVKNDIKTLCGMALSNKDIPPYMIAAFMGICVCGDRFHDKEEQKAVLIVLDEIESKHGWPTATTRRMLLENWGWQKEDTNE